MTELALATAPPWPPDRPAIEGPPRIDLERAVAPPVGTRWRPGPYIQHLVWKETAPDRHTDSAHGVRPSFFTPQVLHCSGILGNPVADAIPVLQRKSLTVRWLAAAGPTTTGSPPNGYVVSGTALPSSTVLLDVTPEPLDTPDFRSFQTLANKGC